MITPPSATKAVIYCRISDDKAGEGLGVIRQQTDCERLAKSLGWTIAQIIVENDRSAYSGRKRPGYEQLLDGLRDGTFDGVIAWHADRLHRRPIELEEYIHVCQAQGVRTHTVKGGEVELATPEGMLRAGMLGQIARYESAHKSDRITRAHQQAAEQGRWRGGGRPFGYLADGTTPHPVEAPAIAQAYDDFLSGKGLNEIAQSWNSQGLRSSRGKPFGTVTFRTILLRERNMGASVYKGEIVKRDAFTPIVSEDTFAAAKAVLTSPARRRAVSNQGRWLLSGLALCGICSAEGVHAKMGAGMVRSSDGSQKHTVYKCRVKHHMGRRANYCDDYITHLVFARLARPDAKNFLNIGERPDATDLHQQIAGLREKLAEYAAMLADDSMTAAQFREATAFTRKRLEDAEKKLFGAQQPAALRALVEAPDVRATWDGLSWAQKQAVVDALMVVTFLPTNRKASRFFDPKYIKVEWRQDGA
ncbi:recombinase family protein [Paeniglutamicibacter sp. R2-26]|uniref:recombinase family protein n=1 Tax=Paeniglutamicibacter sp. R2-26 TaxID=3144417 RepID=UPI003EE7D3CB